MAFDRRSLLLGSAAIGAGAALEACKNPEPVDKAPDKPAPVEDKPPSDDNLSGQGVSGPVLEVLTAVCERVLPSDGTGPGAKEASVGYFLETTLPDPRLSHLLPLLKRGAGFLARASTAKFKQSRFAALSDERKDELLRGLVDKKLRPKGFDGPTFVRIMVALTLEGFLSDPKHGGNKDRVAWKWLKHDPHGGRAVTWGQGT
jgi:gluconate 2-dehydrogenase gamma chain